MNWILLDRITQLAPPERAVGEKTLASTEPLFGDHFPGHPVVPGSLLIEAMAQLGGALLEATARQRGQNDHYAVLLIVERAKFRHMVGPDERMQITATAVSSKEDGGHVHATVSVNQKKMAEAQLLFGLAVLDNPETLAHRRAQLEQWLAS